MFYMSLLRVLTFCYSL